MKYKIFLIDLDDTLLDFRKSEQYAISEVLKLYNIEPTQELIDKYHEIDMAYWKMFEQHQISKPELLVKRFEEFFFPLNIYTDAKVINKTYLQILSSNPFVIDGADDFLEDLSKFGKIYIISNGVKKVQKKRLSLVDITKYFTKVYISEEVGYQKPKVEFFNYIKEDLMLNDFSQTVIIGDSISADIQGGINSGIDTIWYNPKSLKNVSNAKYEAKTYEDILNIVYDS